MPKFYIQDGVEQTVLHADSALQACFFAIKYRFEGIPVNGFYVASEKGFENHEDDTVFSSDEVIAGFLDMMSKLKPKKTAKKRKPKKDDEGD
jgi:hypothetical protein